MSACALCSPATGLLPPSSVDTTQVVLWEDPAAPSALPPRCQKHSRQSRQPRTSPEKAPHAPGRALTDLKPRRHRAWTLGSPACCPMGQAPAHLAASAVRAGWLPAAAGRGRGRAAARWEVADRTGYEVTCTHLRGDSTFTRQRGLRSTEPRVFLRTRPDAAPRVQRHEQTPLGTCGSADASPRN